MLSRAWTTVLGVGLGLLLGVAPASGQGPAPATGWQFELTPYLWLAGISGDVGVGGAPTVSIDASFSDIVKNLDFGAMLAFEARRGPWGLLLDGMYLKVSQGGDTRGPVIDRVDVVGRTAIITPAVGYRVWEGSQAAMDAFAGTRIWVIDTDLKFTVGRLGGRRFEDTKAWADPIVGGRVRVGFGDQWSAVLLGDVGGFGAASDLTWQVFAGIGYQFTERWSLKVGYRALGVDYESGGFLFDVIQHGPLVGVGFRF